MVIYVVWQHRNGRSYRRRLKDGQQWTIPQRCVQFRYETVSGGV